MQRAVYSTIADVGRLLIEMPPRHGKTLFLQYVVGWYFGRWPDRKVIYAAHTKALTELFGGKVRRDLELHGPEVFGVNVSKDTRAKADFIVEGDAGGVGGEFYGVGVGGAPHGRGAHLLVTDDLVPNAEASRSPVQMAGIEDFLRNDLMSRRMPGFVHLGVQTRWSERDPHGILTEAWPDLYQTLRFRAIAEDDDPLGREPGEALWPSFIPLKDLLEQRSGMHPYRWSALYQQRPTPEAGGIWRRSWWDECRYSVDEAGRYVLGPGASYGLDALTRYTVADLAFSERKTADYTVIGTFGVTPESPGRVIVLDIHRERMEYPKLWPTVRRIMDRYGSRVIYVEEEGQQRMVVQDGRSKGYPVKTIGRATTADVRISGDKVNVAHESTPMAASGRMWVPMQAHWVADWEHELLVFPNAGASGHDDMADVTAWGLRIADSIPRGISFVPSEGGQGRSQPRHGHLDGMIPRGRGSARVGAGSRDRHLLG